MNNQQAAPKPTRARVWAALRANKHRDLDVGLLADKAGAHVDAVLHHIQGLVKAGYVHVTTLPRKTGFDKKLYRLVKDTGVDAPMINNDGTVSDVGVKNANMWRTMRMLGRFNCAELEAHASTSEHPLKSNTVRKYVSHLHLAGYLEVDGTQQYAANGGKKPNHYRLVKNTGAKAPMVQKLQTVYDQNLNKIMWQEEAGNE